MHISKVSISNFRLLKNSVLDLRKEISLLVGKNNTGKTSLLVLFEKFFYNSNSFHYNDFSISLREQIHTINENTEVDDLTIRMVLEIAYDENDNLENLSEFILDLDPDIKTVKILFECCIAKDALLNSLLDYEGDREKYLSKILSKYLYTKISIFDDSEHDGNDDFFKSNRHKFIEKDLKDIKHLINLQIIHARRNVASSEDNSNKKPLSALTTAYFNSEHELDNEDIAKINEITLDMDQALGVRYKLFFKDFLKNSKNFLNLGNLSVISNIQSQMLFDNSSQVIYGSEDSHLPEHLNGLGYMNILFLLLTIETKKNKFLKDEKDINLLFIEEPEAHTHPQMQYIFSHEIKNVLKDIDSLQTIITSHSSHIVSQSDFEDIRYLKLHDSGNIEIKNFHTELKSKYSSSPDHFKFLQQYLNIQSAELFFASKVIFIEGITERMLLPYFIQQFDKENDGEDYNSLASHNISMLEIGANAKVFAPFLEFLDIKTLIITDIDTTDKNANRKAVAVSKGNCTSNVSLRYFYKSPEKIQSKEFGDWFKKLIEQTLIGSSENINVKYQSPEIDHHARSFEEAFINVNRDKMLLNKDFIYGLKNKSELDDNNDIYDLTEKIIDKKSDFAASLLYLALANDEVDWVAPLYIKESIAWIREQ